MVSDFNIDIIDKVFENVNEAIQASALASYCQILAGLFTLAYVGNIFWNTWGKGQDLHVIDFAKPFVVLFCIMNFSLVTGTLDALIYEPLKNGTTALVDKNNNVLDEWKKYQDKLKQRKNQEMENASLIDRAERWITETKEEIMGAWILCGVTIFNFFAQILCVLAKTCIICYSGLLRIILSIFGPVAFALSLIPYFKDNIKNWLGKYIGALLYIPICNIILYITQCFATAYFQLQIVDIDANPEWYEGVIDTDKIWVPIMFLVSACAYFTVPSLAGFILSMAESAGSAGIGSAVKSVATTGGTIAAGIATGGASLTALGDGGFLQSIGQIINAFKGSSGGSNSSSDNNSGDSSNDGNSGVKGDG